MPIVGQQNRREVPGETPPLVLGLDGGGTKTVAWLARYESLTSQPTIGVGTDGPSNPQTVGLETAQRNMLSAIQSAFADARLEPTRVAAACLALAGVGREPIRQAVLDWGRSMPLARHLTVVHDAQAVLHAGTTAGQGIVLICGTGSFAYGENSARESARSGGWGHLIDDGGSGFALGQALLLAVARNADGRGVDTLLTSLVLRQLKLTQPWELIPRIYGSSHVREEIASLAPCVFQAAQQNDLVARRICRQATTALSQLVASIVDPLHFAPAEYELALAGSVLIHQPEFCQAIRTRLERRGLAPRTQCVVRQPVCGAVRLACRILQA